MSKHVTRVAGRRGPAMEAGSLGETQAGRMVPARMVPVPSDVSPEMQASIRRTPSSPLPVPKTAEEWRAAIAKFEPPEQMHEAVLALQRKFPVTVTSGQTAGVATFTVRPPFIPLRNRNRAFVYVHGGGYLGGGGEAGLDEAILLAHYARMKIISVDYRRPPEHLFPAAVDDAMTVWREVVRTVEPKSAGMGGASAGGGLAMAVVMKLRDLKLPLPGAVFAGSPWADLTNSGDSAVTNECLDVVLSGKGEWLLAAGRLYAGTHDIRDPLISPVFGDFSHFPATILVTGTRDFLLSDTVRVHRKLRRAGVEADLLVFEAMSHGDFVKVPELPESREAYHGITQFLDRYLRI
jgi:epsilon-lactone hydrolase